MVTNEIAAGAVSRVGRVVPLILGVVALQGCQTMSEIIQDWSVQRVVSRSSDQDGKVDPVNLDTFTWKERANEETAYRLAAGSQTSRNRLQREIMRRSDVACDMYIKKLFVAHSGRKVLTQSSAILLSGAAAVVGGTPATVLSGLAAATLGIDGVIDAEVLQNQFIATIITKIEAERKSLHGDIMNYQDRKTTNYSREAALADAVRYNLLCSSVRAIVLLSNDATNKYAQAEALLNVRKENLLVKLKNARAEVFDADGNEKTGLALKYAQEDVTRIAAEYGKLVGIPPKTETEN